VETAADVMELSRGLTNEQGWDESNITD